VKLFLLRCCCHYTAAAAAVALPSGEGANTVLAGILRGCGRQKIGATINLVTYWGFGLPFSCLLAFPGKLGALGLWTGLACSASIQALLMTITVFRWAQDSSQTLNPRKP
jgi:MATE family multidrug resistance protein